jgi:hypothetical protein
MRFYAASITVYHLGAAVADAGGLYTVTASPEDHDFSPEDADWANECLCEYDYTCDLHADDDVTLAEAKANGSLVALIDEAIDESLADLAEREGIQALLDLMELESMQAYLDLEAPE